MNRTNSLTLFFFLFCFFISFCGSAQKTEKKFAVTAAPAVLHRVVFQPGFQYTFNNWAVLGEVAYMSAERMDFDRGHWLRAQAELKRFLNKDDARFYCSFQTAFSARKFIDDDSGFYFTQKVLDTGAAYSSAVIHSPVLSFAPKIGLEASLGKTVFLDAFIGFGVRILFNRYNAKGVTPTRVYHKREWGPDAAWRYNETVTTFHFPVGLRLGVRF
jgi:hypothetical protein